MEDIILKYRLLDKESRKEVLNLIERLLKKKKFEPTAYQKKLLQVSTWSESDIDEVKNNNSIKGWTAQNW